jgi:hypothetical protein
MVTYDASASFSGICPCTPSSLGEHAEKDQSSPYQLLPPPEVMSSLITSLSVISKPASDHFDNPFVLQSIISEAIALYIRQVLRRQLGLWAHLASITGPFRSCPLMTCKKRTNHEVHASPLPKDDFPIPSCVGTTGSRSVLSTTLEDLVKS